MTIEEIKEWRKSPTCSCQAYLNIDTLFAEVDRLKEEGERDRCHGRDFIQLWKEGKERITELENTIATLNDCKGCDLPRRINIATEALERIVSEGDYTAPEGMKYIARTTLERILG